MSVPVQPPEHDARRQVGLRSSALLAPWRTARRESRRVAAPSVALQDLLARVSGAAWMAGNSAALFFDGATAAAAMLEAIDGARHEVLLESYIFADDATGRALGKSLAQAARRGVAVRVLADAFGSLTTSSSFWNDLRESDVEIRRFHSWSAPLASQRNRDHRKILAIDRRIAFTGGMNVADEYALFRRGASTDVGSMRDTQVSVRGPAAGRLAGVFAEGWVEAGGGPLQSFAVGDEGPAGTALALVLPSREGHGHVETAAVLAAILGTARREIWISVGYFAPHRQCVALLCEAAARGVDVRLLLPGPTDVPLVRHAGHSSFGRLLARGVRVFEYQPAVLHAKTMVADRRVSVVGSSNLDVRSFRYNAECNLVLYDEDCGERLAAAFARDLEDSVELDLEAWRRRGALHRAADEAAGLLTPLL
jgi:cardiolipin synthase